MNFTPFPGLGPPHHFLPSSKVGDIQTEPNILNHTVSTTANSSLFQESNHNVADYCDKSHGGVFTVAPSHINNSSNSEDRPSEWINPNRNPVQQDRNSFTVTPSHPNDTMGVIWHQKTETQNASTMTDLETPEDLCKSSATKESNNIFKSSVNGHGVLPNGNWDSCSRIHLQRQGNAMALYLARLQPSSLPLSIQQFLNRLNIKQEKDNVFKQKPKNRDFKPRNSEIIVSTNLDGTTLYCCPECRMAYPEKDRLEAHMAVHKSERRFECNVCGACLKRKEHLDQHKRRHSEERPFVCEICCKGFKRNEHLRRHFIIHSGNKMYTCHECGKAFSRKDHLNKHAQTHVTKRIQPDGVGGSMMKLDNAD